MYQHLKRACYLLLLCVALTGCGSLKEHLATAALSVAPCSPPSDLMVPAELPPPLPDKSLSHREIVTEWGKDLERLQTEVGKRNDLAQFVGEQCK